MSNTRPPYGDPSQWGQQPPAGQDPSAQFMPGQPAYGQYGQSADGYASQNAAGGQPSYGQSQPWQPQNWQPQARQAQENYQQQSWQPYGQQTPQQPWQASTGPYQQGGYSQQGSYQQNTYPQGGYHQSYPQQNWQQPNGQQSAPLYQQVQQNGQPLQQGYPSQPQAQFFPAQGYSGYVTAPSGKGKESGGVDGEVITKVVLFGVLPVLFLLGVLMKNQPLCWAFLGVAAVTVAAMWLKELVDSKLRLITTLLCGVMAVVALVVALNGPGQTQDQRLAGNTPGANAGISSTGAGDIPTPTPTQAPTATPDPYAESGAAAEVLQSFFYLWHCNNDESMLALTAPSWRAQQQDPQKALFTIRANRTPEDDCEIVSISGSESDTMRTAKVKVTINRHITGYSTELLSFNVVMLKENGVWYVDPQSLASNVKETTTQAAYNPMPTQPVLRTGSPDMVLYYNPDGGEMYHADQNCEKIHPKYLPLKGQFLFRQLNDAPYNELTNCTYCSAPLRDE